MTYIKEYNQQKANAKHRDIPWQFTYDEWINWWGADIDKRGKGKGKLCMCRKNDEGSYDPDNVFKESHEYNVYSAHFGKSKGSQSKELVECRAAMTRGVALGPQTKLICPQCNKIGGNNMKRYHFNFCKEKAA